MLRRLCARRSRRRNAVHCSVQQTRCPRMYLGPAFEGWDRAPAAARAAASVNHWHGVQVHQAGPRRSFGGVTILDFDAEQAGLIDTMYATPDVVAQRQFVLGLLDLKPGERVLDIGSGPGYLIRYGR